jgi:hypothetical protein
MSTLAPQNSTTLSNNSSSTITPQENWQQEFLVKLLLRDRREKAFSDFVEACRFSQKLLLGVGCGMKDFYVQFDWCRGKACRLTEISPKGLLISLIFVDNALAKRLAHYAERNIELERQYNIIKEDNSKLLEETEILREQGWVWEQLSID